MKYLFKVPTVSLANFSLFLGQLMFTFTTSICEVFSIFGTGEQCIHCTLASFAPFTQFVLLETISSASCNFTYFFCPQSTALQFVGKTKDTQNVKTEKIVVNMCLSVCPQLKSRNHADKQREKKALLIIQEARQQEKSERNFFFSQMNNI